MAHPRRPRILFVDHVSKVLGGAEVNLTELLGFERLPRTWEAAVACAPDSPLARALEPSGLRRFDHAFAAALNEMRVVGRRFNPVAQWRGLVEVRRAADRLAGVLGDFRPDAVISCTNKDHFTAGAAARRTGVPSLWWVNDIVSPDFFSWPVRQMFFRRARRLATRLLPVSNFGRAALRAGGLPDDRLVTIHNGIPIDHYRCPDRRDATAEPARGGPVIGIVGRLTPWKGQHVFLDIATRWCAEGRPGKFVLIGRAFNEDAPYEARLRETVRERRLEQRVEFLAFQPDIRLALGGLDVLLHCSTKPEPFGRVLIEAMALGVPVVAARDGGVPEIVNDGVDGFLARPGDMEAYLQALARLAESSKLRARIGAAGRRTVESRFSLERVFADFEAVVDAAIAQPGR